MNLKFNIGSLNVKVPNEDVTIELADLEIEVTEISIPEATLFLKEMGTQIRATDAQDFNQSVEGMSRGFMSRFQSQR